MRKTPTESVCWLRVASTMPLDHLYFLLSCVCFVQDFCTKNPTLPT